MILVDTSVWVDHLRRGDAEMQRQLDAGMVRVHPFVIGEIALGQLPRRAETLGLLSALPQSPVANEDELMAFISVHRLYGRGIGLVDAHLLASAALAGDTTLWTRDKRLAAAAVALGRLHAPRLH